MGNSVGSQKKDPEPIAAATERHALYSFDEGTDHEMSPKTSLFSRESLILKYDDKFHERNDTNLSAHQVCLDEQSA